MDGFMVDCCYSNFDELFLCNFYLFIYQNIYLFIYFFVHPICENF